MNGTNVDGMVGATYRFSSVSPLKVSLIYRADEPEEQICPPTTKQPRSSLLTAGREGLELLPAKCPDGCRTQSVGLSVHRGCFPPSAGSH